MFAGSKSNSKNRDLAVRFANGATEGKGSNMFIAGDTIYSYGYHFEIAKRIERNGATAYLFNSERYGSTTSQHQSYVRNAISGEIICCPGCVIDNLKEYYSDEVDELYRKLRKARSLFPRYISQLRGTRSAWEYAKKHYGLADRGLTMKLKFEKVNWLSALMVQHRLMGRC